MCGWEWWPERKGTVTGLVVACFGFGALVFSFICQGIVNPENEQPEELPNGESMFSEDIAESVPSMFKVMGFTWIGLGVLSALLIKRNP